MKCESDLGDFVLFLGMSLTLFQSPGKELRSQHRAEISSLGPFKNSQGEINQSVLAGLLMKVWHWVGPDRGKGREHYYFSAVADVTLPDQVTILTRTSLDLKFCGQGGHFYCCFPSRPITIP